MASEQECGGATRRTRLCEDIPRPGYSGHTEFIDLHSQVVASTRTTESSTHMTRRQAHDTHRVKGLGERTESGSSAPGYDLASLNNNPTWLSLQALNRTRASLASLTLTIALNMTAGILTLAYVNGTTIVETNRYSAILLQEIGAGTLVVHAAEIAVLYLLAYLMSRAISSKRRLFSAFHARPIYLFAFCLLIAVLPAGAFFDLLSDVLVVLWTLNILVGPTRVVTLSLACAIPFALVQTKRKWSLLPQS